MSKIYDDLCEYYNVTPEQALELGSRSSGRKPNLPASATTTAVSNMTYEDLWALKERKTEQDVFDFYEDQGAWSSFRQVVRHKDMTGYHLQMLGGIVAEGSVLCEYGCGIAPFVYSLLSNLSKTDVNLTVCISDVKSEHFRFAIWRLEKLISQMNLTGVILIPVEIKAGELPKFPVPLDVALVFEVLEHVPSPVATLNNLANQLNTNGLICENFILHGDEKGDSDGPDLLSARRERTEYYNELFRLCNLVGGPDHVSGPNETRIWQKK